MKGRKRREGLGAPHFAGAAYIDLRLQRWQVSRQPWQHLHCRQCFRPLKSVSMRALPGWRAQQTIARFLVWKMECPLRARPRTLQGTQRWRTTHWCAGPAPTLPGSTFVGLIGMLEKVQEEMCVLVSMWPGAQRGVGCAELFDAALRRSARLELRRLCAPAELLRVPFPGLRGGWLLYDRSGAGHWCHLLPRERRRSGSAVHCSFGGR